MSVNVTRLIPTALIVGGSLALYSLLSGNTIMAECALEYEQSCKIHAIGSAEADKCLRDLGDKASPKCVAALQNNEPMKIVSDVPEQKPEEIMPKEETMKITTQEVPSTAEPISTVEPIAIPEIKAQEPVTTEALDFPPKEEPVLVQKKTVKKVAKKYSKDDDTFERLGNLLDGGKNAVTRTIKKTTKAIKEKYKKVTKGNIEYASRPEIIEQNMIRKYYVHEYSFIMPEGINANFGRR